MNRDECVGALDSRRVLQALHNAARVTAIRKARAAGLSGRNTAQALEAAGISRPLGHRSGAIQITPAALWDHLQVNRFARRRGSE